MKKLLTVQVASGVRRAKGSSISVFVFAGHLEQEHESNQDGWWFGFKRRVSNSD
jgi:hypothetical protein